MKKFKLSELAEMFDGKVIGDENLEVIGLNGLDHASETEIVYLDNMKFAKRLNDCKSLAVIVEKEIADKLTDTRQQAQKHIQDSAEQAREEAGKIRENKQKVAEDSSNEFLEKNKDKIEKFIKEITQQIITTGYEKGQG